ncbi:Uncharacterised protein r2_g802 [Pycnogonum litorale]
MTLIGVIMMETKRLLVAIVLLKILVNCKESCPRPSLIAPCFCSSWGAIHIEVKCVHRNITSIYKAIDHISSLGLVVYHFHIGCNDVEYLRPNLLQNIPVSGVFLDFPKLKTLNNSVLSGQEANLRTIQIKNAKFFNIPVFVIRNMRRLLSVSIIKCENVKTIKDNIFSFLGFPANILAARLIQNNISYIGSGAFRSLVNLSFLSLVGNNIQQLLISSLPISLAKLKMIDLRFNQIRGLSVQLLSRMRIGSQLQLEFNNITNISTDSVVTILERKLFVDLSFNKIDCSCSLIPYISMKHDSIEFLRGRCNTPNNLKTVSFRKLRASDFNCVTPEEHMKQVSSAAENIAITFELLPLLLFMSFF